MTLFKTATFTNIFSDFIVNILKFINPDWVYYGLAIFLIIAIYFIYYNFIR